jgi:hypothetical protein
MRATYLNAICALHPNAAVEMSNPNDFSTMKLCNFDEVGTIDKDVLEQWMVTRNDLERMNLLRKERNRLLAECDWISLRAVSTNTHVPADWAAYMQTLRDLPNNTYPILTPTGQLDMSSVEWPVKPPS